MRPLRGDRLMIISNGAAPAALALDALWSRNGKLATLSEETCQKLRDALPEHVAVSNPLDLRDDASSEHYVKTLDILLHSQDFDALMVIHSPSAAAPATESAQVLIEAVKHHPPQQICLFAEPTGAASTPRKRHDVYSAKPGCRPTVPRKEPSLLLCIWWSTGVIRSNYAKRRRCPAI
ncbi:hypothetical protein ACLBR5_10380 [Escherichia coli]